MDSKVCPMDLFNIAFNPTCPFFPFGPNRLMEIKVCPMDSFNPAFSPACLSHHFCP